MPNPKKTPKAVRRIYEITLILTESLGHGFVDPEYISEMLDRVLKRNYNEKLMRFEITRITPVKRRKKNA